MTQYRLHYLHHAKKKSKLIRLFSVSVLLELNLTRLLDEVANMAAARGKEISATVAGDVVAVTSVTSLNGLQEARNTNATSDGVSKTSTSAGITTIRVGSPTVVEVVEPAAELRVHNAGTEGGGETGTAVTEASEERVGPFTLATAVQRQVLGVRVGRNLHSLVSSGLSVGGH